MRNSRFSKIKVVSFIALLSSIALAFSPNPSLHAHRPPPPALHAKFALKSKYTLLSSAILGVLLGTPKDTFASEASRIPPMETVQYRQVEDETEEEDVDYDYEEDLEEEDVTDDVTSKPPITTHTKQTPVDDPMSAFGSVTKAKLSSSSNSGKSASDVLQISPDVAFKQFVVPTAFVGAAGYMIKFHMNEDKGVEEAIQMFEKERAEYFNITSVVENELESNGTSVSSLEDDLAVGEEQDDDNDGEDDSMNKKKRKKKKKSGKKKKKSVSPTDDVSSDDSNVTNEDSNDEENDINFEENVSGKRKPPKIDIDAIVESAARDTEQSDGSKKSDDPNIEDERERLKRMFGK